MGAPAYNLVQQVSKFNFQEENHQLKEENKHLQDVLEGNITEIIKDITELRIHQGHTEDVFTGKIFQPFIESIVGTVTSNVIKLFTVCFRTLTCL